MWKCFKPCGMGGMSLNLEGESMAQEDTYVSEWEKPYNEDSLLRCPNPDCRYVGVAHHFYGENARGPPPLWQAREHHLSLAPLLG